MKEFTWQLRVVNRCGYVNGDQVDILEGGGAHDSYGVLVIRSPTNNGSSSVNCDTTAATTLRQVSARPAGSDVSNDDRRWLGRAYRKQLSAWDSIRSKQAALYMITSEWSEGIAVGADCVSGLASCGVRDQTVGPVVSPPSPPLSSS